MRLSGTCSIIAATIALAGAGCGGISEPDRPFVVMRTDREGVAPAP